MAEDGWRTGPRSAVDLAAAALLAEALAVLAALVRGPLPDVVRGAAEGVVVRPVAGRGLVLLAGIVVDVDTEGLGVVAGLLFGAAVRVAAAGLGPLRVGVRAGHAGLALADEGDLDSGLDGGA